MIYYFHFGFALSAYFKLCQNKFIHFYFKFAVSIIFILDFLSAFSFFKRNLMFVLSAFFALSAF